MDVINLRTRLRYTLNTDFSLPLLLCFHSPSSQSICVSVFFFILFISCWPVTLQAVSAGDGRPTHLHLQLVLRHQHQRPLRFSLLFMDLAFLSCSSFARSFGPLFNVTPDLLNGITANVIILTVLRFEGGDYTYDVVCIGT